MPLLRALYEATEDQGEAVRVGEETLSREALLGAATALADELRGAPAVALRATPTLTTVIGVLGALIAGVPLAPVAPDAGPAERAHILRDSGAVLLLAPPGEAGDDAPGVPRLPVVAVETHRRSASSHPEPQSQAAALILYTSGTTGAPKGAVLSRDAIAADLDALAEAWSWTPQDILVHGLPLFHVHGLVLGVLGALRVGSRLHHTGRPTPAAYASAGGTLYFGVPTVWSRVCQDPDSAAGLRGARLLVSGSAPLPVPVFNRLTELTGQPPVERYGMTETLITLSTRALGARRAGFVGTPLAGVSTRLVGEDGEEVPHDGQTIGELRVRGPMLFDGYLNRPELSAASADAQGWFRTGDLATIDGDGWHRIVGRASTDLIKSGGYRIGAGEVENVLLAHPAVREAAVVGRPHHDLGEQVVAFVVAEGASAQALIDFVARELSVHKRPRQVHFVDSLPRNAMGKVQKKLLTAAVQG